MHKRVYIAYTGGSIGMKKTSDGYVPAPGFLEEQMGAIPELKGDIMPEYDIQEYVPLLDSSNITPAYWLKIAKDIAINYHRYDGFVVLHGTDTMAYTASALPFMLQGLRKPVILTGAQIPLCEVRNDARENLITAMLIAANFAIPEVCLCFGNRLLRGNRSVKVDALGFDAFASPSFPPLGTVGMKIEIHWNLILTPTADETQLTVNALRESKLVALRIFPGISVDVVRNILQPPTKGMVLETYGIGNGPTRNRELMTTLAEAVNRGVIIVNCSQCLKARVNMGAYATGSELAKVGVISGYDMTTEAAIAKMFYLLSQNLDTDTIKEMMQKNLRGELTADIV